MTTRLNTFFVKALNIMKYFFSKLKYRLVKVLKKGIIPAHTSFCKSSFVKFNELLANRFFMIKKGINTFENREKGSRRKNPHHYISTVNVFGFINKMELASKTWSNPIKTWNFSISTLQLDFISRIWLSLRKVFLNIQTTFRINKTCKISKIFIGGNYGILNRFQIIL